MPGRLLAGASLTALGAGAGAALYAWRESTWVEATERVVRLAGLPAGLEGLRILHVSDTHFPADGASLPRFLETVSGAGVRSGVGQRRLCGDIGGVGDGGAGVDVVGGALGGVRNAGGARLLRAGADGGGVGVVVAGSGAGAGGVGSWIRRRS